MIAAPPVLMVPAWRYTAGTLLPVAERLREKGVPVRFLLHDWDDRTGPEIEALGFACETLDLPRPRGSYLTRIALGHRTPHVLRERAWRRLARTRIAALRPRLLVVNNESWFESALIREAARKGTKSLAVQWAFALPQRYFDEQRKDIVRRLGGTPKSFHFGREMDEFGGPTKRSPLHHLAREAIRPVQAANAFLAARLVGLPHVNPSWGTGAATLKTLIGPAFREQFASQGADAGKMRVTGLPEHDGLFALAGDAARRERYRREIRQQFGVAPDVALAVVGARATREDGYPASEVYDELRAVVSALLDRPEGLFVIVKLHPRQTVAEVSREVGPAERVAFVRDIDKGPLFAAADLFLSTFSSVILWAIALDLPVVTFNCLRIPGGDIFEEIGGTVHARTTAGLPEAIRLAIADEATADRLATERKRVCSSHMVFDGRAVERIEGLCRELDRPEPTD